MSQEPGFEPTSEAAHRLITAMESRDWTGVADIIEQDWASLMSTDGDLLKRALTALPPEVMAARPRLALAANYVSYLPVDGQTRTEIFRATPPSGELTSVLDVLAELTSRTASRRSSGEFERAADDARRAVGVLSTATDAQLDGMQNALPELHYQWGLAFEFAGFDDDAVREFTESFDLSVMVGNLPIQTQASGSLAWSHALSGRRSEAERWLARVPASTGAAWESRASVPAGLARALVELRAMEFAAGRAALASVGPVTEKPEYWASRLYVRAVAAEGSAEVIDALVEIESSVKARPVALGATGTNGRLLSLARAKLLLKRGQLARARAELAHADTNNSFAAISARVLSARAAVLAGDYVGATRILGQFGDVAGVHPHVFVEALLISAVAHAASGASDLAREDALQAFSVAEREQAFLALATLSPAHLDEVIAAAGVEPSHLEAIRAVSSTNSAEKITALTAQELVVLTALADTGSVRAASEQLFLSLNTVKSHLRRIYSKLGVNNKAEAIATASNYGILRAK